MSSLERKEDNPEEFLRNFFNIYTEKIIRLEVDMRWVKEEIQKHNKRLWAILILLITILLSLLGLLGKVFIS